MPEDLDCPLCVPVPQEMNDFDAGQKPHRTRKWEYCIGLVVALP